MCSEKDLEDVKKGPFLLKNALQGMRKWGEKEKK
jgi:hypothetical protein